MPQHLSFSSVSVEEGAGAMLSKKCRVLTIVLFAEVFAVAYTSCPPGTRPSADLSTCEDINECLPRNGHGPCQDTCTNTFGSYVCGCRGLNGTHLAEDGHNCTCPEGMELGSDWRTCRWKVELEGSGDSDDDDGGGTEEEEGEDYSFGDAETTTSSTEVTDGEGATQTATEGFATMVPKTTTQGFQLGVDEEATIETSTIDIDAAASTSPEEVTTATTFLTNVETTTTTLQPTTHLAEETTDAYDLEDEDEVTTVSQKCPPGYERAANGECAAEDRRSCHGCKNGSRCACPTSSERYPINCTHHYELTNDGGGSCARAHCPPSEPPPRGTARCTPERCVFGCERGYRLEGDRELICEGGSWSGASPKCTRASCPGLKRVADGFYLPGWCGDGPVFSGDTCRLRCKGSGGRATVFTCRDDLRWTPSPESAVCRKAPFIRCPGNGRLEFTLPPGRNQMAVGVPRPHTNVDWRKYVTAEPEWGMFLRRTLSAGRTTVTYRAFAPGGEATSACQLVIDVVDREEPSMEGCPGGAEYVLGRYKPERVVYWEEPRFSDNVGIVSLYRSKAPGSSFQRGLHRVTYVASDYAGNRAICYFTIRIVGGPYQRVPQNLGPKYKTVLICPKGVRYLSQLPDYRQEALITAEGCHVIHERVNDPPIENRYRIQQVYSGSALPKGYGNKYSRLYWYNKCC